MESNVESVLSDLGISYHFYGNAGDKKKKTFRRVATIQQGKEDDLCYCSFDGEEAVSIIILCKKSLKEFLDEYYQVPKNNTQLRHQIILVDNPRAAFIKIINKIYPKTSGDKNIK